MDWVQEYTLVLLVLDFIFYIGMAGYCIGDQKEDVATVFFLIFPVVQMPLLPIIGRIFGWW